MNNISDSTRIRNLLFNFILNMTSWQEKIENKLTALTALQEKANRNTIDVYREYAEADKDKHHHTSQPGRQQGNEGCRGRKIISN